MLKLLNKKAKSEKLVDINNTMIVQGPVQNNKLAGWWKNATYWKKKSSSRWH